MTTGVTTADKNRPEQGQNGLASWHSSRSEEHTSELQSHSDLHSFPTRRSSDLRAGAMIPPCDDYRCNDRRQKPSGAGSKWLGILAFVEIGRASCRESVDLGG